MSGRTLAVGLILVVTIQTSLLGQLISWAGGQNAKELFFDGLPPGAPAARFFAQLGVEFSGAGLSAPVGDFITRPGVDFSWPVVSNEPMTGDSAWKPLVVRFVRPVRSVGFEPGEGKQNLVTVSAYTDAGELTGTLERSAGFGIPGNFIGVTTHHAAGITTLVINYGDFPENESIYFLTWLPLEPTPFQTFVAQVAAGRTGGYIFETELQIQNLILMNTSVKVEFFDQQGLPAVFRINGQERSSVNLELGSGASARLLIADPTGSGKIGYARLTSDWPVVAEAAYRTLDGEGRLLQEAGVQGTPLQFQQFVPVERDTSRGLDTAIAVVNLDNELAHWITLALIDEAGNFVFPGGILAHQFQPGEQRAAFLKEIFPSIPDKFAGSFVVGGGRGTTATALRTLNGVAVSSLPVVSSEH